MLTQIFFERFFTNFGFLLIFSHICKCQQSVSEPNLISPQTTTMVNLTLPLVNYDFNSSGRPWESDPLLPKNVVPSEYHLYMDPDLENGTFQGTVRIGLNITARTDYILLHTYQLNITSTDLSGPNGLGVTIKETFEYAPNQFWVVILEEAILPGRYELAVAFNGSLLRKIVGFYRSSYKAPDGSKRFIATTKFEPTYARYAFPCFDEPSFKAQYRIQITRPAIEGYFALSNMDSIKEEPETENPDKWLVTFAQTPPMSTYLVCFIVCDFEHDDPVVTNSNTLITVYARPGQKNNTLFARGIAHKVMNYFTEYFNIEYPLPKLDLIAIPDFVSGAMENWGLVTFRESRILVSEEDSVANQEGCANTVAHELAHMWFGDLVTMAWWDDLWLNEGFATFLASKVVDIVEKDLFSTLDFVVSAQQPVLELDSALTSHPIIQPVNHPDKITEIFDAISYSKGSSILRMFESFSPDSFRTAVKAYLKEHKFSNAKTKDLWAKMEESYGIGNMTRMLDSWTHQMGFPLISVRREGNQLILTQQRYLADSQARYHPESSPFRYQWDVPIMYVTSKSPENASTFIFPLDSKQSTIHLEPGTHWCKLNFNQNGFYRVNYTEEDWIKFKDILFSNDFGTVLSPVDRANLMDDAFSLAKSNYLDYKIPLQLVTYLQVGAELHFMPWDVIAKYATKYINMLHDTPAYTKFMRFGRRLIEASYSNQLWEVNNNSSNLEKLLKSSLLSFACRIELPKALEKASELFSNWIEERSDKPNTLIRKLVYTYGVRGPNETAYREKLWMLYVNESDPIEKNNYMTAIASTTNIAILSQLVELIKNEDNVKSQDYFSFLIYMASKPEGGRFVWNFLRSNWSYLVDRFTLNDRLLGRLLPSAVKSFSTDAQLREVEEFMERYPEAGAGETGRKQALETIRNNIRWRQKRYLQMERALDDMVY